MRRVLELKSESVQGVKGSEICKCRHSTKNGRSAFNSFRPTLIDLRVAAKTGLEATDTERNIVVAESLVLVEIIILEVRILLHYRAACSMQQWIEKVSLL